MQDTLTHADGGGEAGGVYLQTKNYFGRPQGKLKTEKKNESFLVGPRSGCRKFQHVIMFHHVLLCGC